MSDSCTYTCMYIYIPILHLHTHIHIYIHMSIQVSLQVLFPRIHGLLLGAAKRRSDSCIYMCTCIYTHMYIHIHIDIDIDTHIYIDILTGLFCTFFFHIYMGLFSRGNGVSPRFVTCYAHSYAPQHQLLVHVYTWIRMCVNMYISIFIYMGVYVYLVNTCVPC